MYDAKIQRKRAQTDVQLFANRLAHLCVEEEKARKRIDDAERRSREISHSKARIAEKERERRSLMEQERHQREEAAKMNNESVIFSRERERNKCSRRLFSRRKTT